MKWGFIPKVAQKPKYIVCNADESEPGTFKDRDIMRYTPHLLLEGMVIAGYAIGSHVGYIYIRGEYTREAKLLNAAIAEAYRRATWARTSRARASTTTSPSTAARAPTSAARRRGCSNSLEGKRGEPRVKPPFPAIAGAFGGPTVVNNVETLANVPFILNKGGEWFAKMGKIEKSGGTRLISISGHVKKPGVYEIDAGSKTIRQLIYEVAGGILGDKKLKAVIPGGSSAPVLTADEIDAVYDIEPLMKIGTMMGSAALMVVSEDYCLVKLILRITKFYAHESCGQCTPCREGCKWMEDVLHRIEHGHGREQDLNLLLEIANNINGRTLCAPRRRGRGARHELRQEVPRRLRSPYQEWKMPKCMIDGREVEFTPGQNLIEVAKKAGIDIPFFCYHPGLTVVAQCRMCTVEIEKMPKLQTACSTAATEGMVVKTEAERRCRTRSP